MSQYTRYLYTGREYDPNTQLYYYRARWYEPQLGRFLSEDPIGFTGGINSYAYVNNNAVGEDDPLGLWPSRWRWKYHQAILTRALSGLGISASEIGLMAEEQGIFDANTQAERFANMHAMRRRGQSPEDARREANSFVRRMICRARALDAKGMRRAALIALSQAIHTLQDSTSPAHANFQEAWEDNFGEMVKHGSHYINENFDPGAGSAADGVTVSAWWWFTGQMPMPDDFFGNLYDISPNHQGFFIADPAPDGGKCDCEK